MSTATTKPVLAPVAADELVRTLMSTAAYSWWNDKPALTVGAATEAVARALLAVMRDATAEEWDGPETGMPYRTYRGVLPSYLPVEIVTWRDEVPDLLNAGGVS